MLSSVLLPFLSLFYSRNRSSPGYGPAAQHLSIVPGKRTTGVFFHWQKDPNWISKTAAYQAVNLAFARIQAKRKWVIKYKKHQYFIFPISTTCCDILPANSLAVSLEAGTGLLWGLERKCQGYEPQGDHKESYSIFSWNSRWFCSWALTSLKEGAASNNRKSVREVHVLGTFMSVSCHGWVMWSIHEGWVFPPQTSFSWLGRMCWQSMGSFTPLKLKIFRFHLISDDLSCKSYIRFETAVKTNTGTWMQWNTSSIFPFSQWIVDSFFPLWANNRK